VYILLNVNIYNIVKNDQAGKVEQVDRDCIDRGREGRGRGRRLENDAD
jgi:hypothetical protein